MDYHDRPMRVIHLESGRHLYGGAQQVCDLMAGLAGEGIDNVLVCPPDSAIAIKARSMRRIAKVVEMPMGGELDFSLPGRLRKLLTTRKPSLLHVHSRRGVDRFGGWNARWAGVPAILTRRVDSAEFKPLAHIKYRPYAAIIAISRAVEAQLTDSVGLAPDRVHYVASGIDTNRYRPTQTRGRLAEVFGLSAETVKIGVVAQLISRKGHEQLFRILPELIASHPAVDVLCFGQGPLKRELEDLIRDLALTARVRLVGFRDDMVQFLPELDCLVHPAQREGLGVAVLEALSCRVPVVVTTVGGLVDVVEHEVNGLLVKPDDDRALLAALRRMVAEPELRRRLGEAGRRRVEEAFSVDAMTRGNLSVYGKVMKGNDDRE